MSVPSSPARFTRWPLAAGLLLALIFAVLVSPVPTLEAQSAPAAPTGLTATHTNNNTVTASWDDDSNAGKYHITYSTDNMNSWSGPTCGDNCTVTGGHISITDGRASFTITGANPAKTYVVGLRAGNQHGWSTWVNSAPATPPNPPPATPGPITITRADGKLTASWDAVSGATKYHVTYSSNHMNSWTAAPCGANCGTSVTLDVNNDLTYYVGVRAGNATGWSDWRNSAAAEPFLTPPDPPTNLKIQRICDHSFQVWWDHMPRATGYDLNISGNKRKSWQRLATNSDKNGWVASWWEKERRYYFAVRALNSAGTSEWVNSGPSYAPPCEVGNLKATTATTHGRTGGSIITSWDSAKRAHAYNVNYRPSGGQWERIQSNVTATTHTGSVSSAGGSYTVAVQSTRDNGMSQWRNVNVSAWLTTTSINGTDVTLNLAGHSGNWYVKKTAPAPAGDCSSAISGATHTVSGLTAVTQHTITAYGDSGCANALAQATFTTGAGLTVSSITENGATLTLAGHSGSWYYKADTGPDTSCSTEQTGTTVTLSGLTEHGTYTYTAYSNSGCTTQIAKATFTTTGDTLTATNVTASSATLTIYNHTGNWYYKADFLPDTACSTAQTGTTVNLTNLIPGTAYTYKAYNDGSCANLIATADAFTTGGVSVSNLDAGGTAGCPVGVSSAFRFTCATAFTTGSATDGYTLHSITALFKGTVGNPSSFTIALYRPDSGNSIIPAASAITNATLSGDAPNVSGSGERSFTYTCSGAGCQLESDKTYFVVMTTPDTSGNAYFSWRENASNSETTTPSGNGWSIADGGAESSYQGQTPTWSTGTSSGLMKVAATVNGLTASSISATGATLTLGGHTGTWYYQGISGTSASTTCVTVSTGTTATLTNLTVNNLYGYTAYSGANCTTAIGTDYFSTNDYDVGNLAETAVSGTRCRIGHNTSATSTQCAVAFDTGGRSGGYTLKSVTGRFIADTGNPGNIIVKLHSADTSNSSNPATTAIPNADFTGSNPSTAAGRLPMRSEPSGAATPGPTRPAIPPACCT